MRRPSIDSSSRTTWFRFTTRACSTCLRLKASSWRVSVAAWLPAFWISSSEAPASRPATVGQLAQQRGVAVDDGEQVVEVVGDAAGQPADRFHLLRLAKMRLRAGQLAFRRAPSQDVAGEGGDDDRLAQDEESGHPNQQPVLAVERARPADDQGRRGQPRFIHAIADQLPVVELVADAVEQFDRDVGRRPPAEHRHREPCRRQAVLEPGVDAARQLSLADAGCQRAVGRGGRGRGNLRNRFAGRERAPGEIARERRRHQQVS